MPTAPGARRLARLLTDRGLAHPVPHPAAPAPTRSVVIPCRDHPTGLAHALAHLNAEDEVIVVDDGSVDAGDLARAAGPATVLRNATPEGPAAARNRGGRVSTGELIAFVDDDVVLPVGALDRLAGHFEDPKLAAVAPRVTSRPGPTTPRWLAAYEACASPLDLGPHPSPVRPRAEVPYVPTPALIVRRTAFEEVGGFDEALRSGEDVDLVWRLGAAGWRVRYDPAVVADHPARADLGGWVRQRVGYGRAAAPLERRHGEATAPLRLGPWQVATAAALLARRPGLAAAAALGAVVSVVRLDRRVPSRSLVALAGRAQLEGLAATAAATRRTWWPLAAILAAAVPRSRPALGAVLTVPPLIDWFGRRPAIDPLRWMALAGLDDAAYAVGVWAGARRERRFRALLPVRTVRTAARGARNRPAATGAAPPCGPRPAPRGPAPPEG